MLPIEKWIAAFHCRNFRPRHQINAPTHVPIRARTWRVECLEKKSSQRFLKLSSHFCGNDEVQVWKAHVTCAVPGDWYSHDNRRMILPVVVLLNPLRHGGTLLISPATCSLHSSSSASNIGKMNKNAVVGLLARSTSNILAPIPCDYVVRCMESWRLDNILLKIMGCVFGSWQSLGLRVRLEIRVSRWEVRLRRRDLPLPWQGEWVWQDIWGAHNTIVSHDVRRVVACMSVKFAYTYHQQSKRIESWISIINVKFKPVHRDS